MDKYTKANRNLSLFCQNYMGLKKSLPIRPSEMGVLNIISQGEESYTSIDLANMLMVSKPMITAHITSLINKGYVTKEQSSFDKRVFYIVPTLKALDLVEKAKTDLSNKIDDIIKSIGEDKFDSFVSITENINKLFLEKWRDS